MFVRTRYAAVHRRRARPCGYCSASARSLLSARCCATRTAPGDIPSIWPVSSAVSPTATRSTQQLPLVLREVGEQLLGPLGVAAEQRALLGAERVVGPLRHLVRGHGRRAGVPHRGPLEVGDLVGGDGEDERLEGPPGVLVARQRHQDRDADLLREVLHEVPRVARQPATAGCGSSAARGGGHGRAGRAWPARPRRRRGARAHRWPPGQSPPRRRASVHGALAAVRSVAPRPSLCTEAL